MQKEVAEVTVPVAEPTAESITPAAESITPAAEPVAPAAEVTAPAIAEATVPVIAEVTTPVVAEDAALATAEVCAPAPAAAVETFDVLTLEKEKVQAAFEEDSCSSQLAIGEQDPLVNEYVIEILAETAACSEARQEALAADVQDRVARYEAAQTALQAPSSA